MESAITIDFNKLYLINPNYFGQEPSRKLVEILDKYQVKKGRALDLGCGQGRNALYLAELGFTVIAIDLSIVGLRQLQENAQERSLHVHCVLQDVTKYAYPRESFDFVIAETLLDHLSVAEAKVIVRGIKETLVDGGLGYVSVFTTSDPGYLLQQSSDNPDISAMASDCASAIKHYFEAGELLELFHDMQTLTYDELLEYDDKHGTPHFHGLAYILFKKTKC